MSLIGSTSFGFAQNTYGSVYFHTLLLIIYLSAIERFICRREMSLIGSTSFGFAQNTIHDFQNTV